MNIPAPVQAQNQNNVQRTLDEIADTTRRILSLLEVIVKSVQTEPEE